MPPSPQTKIKLRDAEQSNRLFWQPSTLEQFSMVVVDQAADYRARSLPQNEIAALALNEIAVDQQRGFFFHLPPWFAWTNKPDPTRAPPGRVPTTPGSDYASLIFMPFVWDDVATMNFLATPQRGRYLNSSFLMNRPAEAAPVYRVQYAPYWRAPMYRTDPDTLICIATAKEYYLLRASEAAEILGIERDDKIKTTANLWNAQTVAGLTGLKKQQTARLQAFSQKTLQDVYEAICDVWQSGSLPATEASNVLSSVPRPSRPKAAEVGVGLGHGISADPKSRKGEMRVSKSRQVVGMEEEGVEGGSST